VKALSLTQPWAYLVAGGFKTMETRSWGTIYRGTIAIHATKGFPTSARRFALAVLVQSATVAALPRGCVVATADLVDVRPTTDDVIRAALDATPQEKLYGDFSAGRYAWLFANVRPVANIPARGMLGLWEWTPEASTQ
jgi:hypothetical protein